MIITAGMMICQTTPKGAGMVGEVLGISRESGIVHYRIMNGTEMFSNLVEVRPYYIQLKDKVKLMDGVIWEIIRIDLGDKGFEVMMRSNGKWVRKGLSTLSRQIEKIYLD